MFVLGTFSSLTVSLPYCDLRLISFDGCHNRVYYLWSDLIVSVLVLVARSWFWVLFLFVMFVCLFTL